MTRSDFLRFVGLFTLGAAAARAQTGHSGHGAMPDAATAPSTADYEAAAARMHADMAIAYTGDPDVDFARGMIPTIAGAIEMARVELAHGADPEILAFAEQVIAAQEAEVAFLERWLAARGR